MAQRKVTILDKAVEEVANVSYFIEGKGLPATAKKFVDSAFTFFENLGKTPVTHKPCSFALWKELNYRCAPFRKKFVVAYLNLDDEIIICDFALQKMLIE
jgi:plasmid stabilization system protein ParE